MTLSKLSDSDLLEALKTKVKEERDRLVELLKYLAEVERRQMYLARGYPSLFAFCVEELNYSEGETHVRIQAMRLTTALPEMTAEIQAGRLSLSVAAKAQGCFRRSSRMSKPVSREKKMAVVQSLLSLSTREAERKLLAEFPQAALPVEIAKPISDEMTRIEFNANREQLAKFEKLKGLLAHKNFEGRWDKLFEELANIALAKFEKKTGGPIVIQAESSVGSAPAKADAPLLEAPQVNQKRKFYLRKIARLSPEAEAKAFSEWAPRSRHIPAAVRKHVWQRDGGRCQFRDPVTGKKCESEHGIEFDHVVPFAHGGEHTAENLWLLCAAHNKFKSDIL